MSPSVWLMTVVVLYIQIHIGQSAEGPICFTCSYVYTGAQVDTECLDDPFNVKTGNKVLRCKEKEVCVTREVAFVSTGIVQSMERTCGIHDPTQVGCRYFLDGERRACNSQCNEDLCNNDVGLSEDDDSDSDSSETQNDDTPADFDPSPVDINGWYRVWVSSSGGVVRVSLLAWLLPFCYMLFGLY